MNERDFPQVSPELEAALQAYYAGPAPSPAFVARLEREMQERHPASAAPLHQRIRGAFARLRRVPAWQLASLALLLLALLALFAIGPRRVLASAQRLLGYVPGMGFVDLDQARVLAAPAAVSKDGVRLQIDELLAEPDRTRLRYSIQGLSTDDFYIGTEEGVESNFEAYLLLPDDERLQATGWSGTVDGEISFPALPIEIKDLTLVLNHLPYVRPEAASENWRVPLQLRPGSGELPVDLYPQPYTPALDPVTLKGVTVRLLQVAQSPTETGVFVEYAWEDPDWRWVSSPSTTLRDDLGHIYQFPSASGTGVAVEEAIVVPEDSAAGQSASTPEASSQIYTDTFAPLSLAAQEGIFTVESLGFSVPFDQGFTINLGEDPRVGQTWRVDRQLESGAYRLQVQEARLLAAPDAVSITDSGEAYQLLLTLQGAGPQDVQINFADIEVGDPDLRGTGSQGDPQAGEIRIELTFTSKPHGDLAIQIPRLQISLFGPWELRWKLPNASGSAGSLRRVSPVNAQAIHNRVSLQVDEALFSDRISAVHVSAPGLPEEVKLQGVLSKDPLSEPFPFYLYPDQEPDLYLEDQWARRLGQPQDVRWYPPGEPGGGGASWIVFAPPGPLTESLNLHVPGVALFSPAEVAMRIDIPDGLSFHEERYAIPERLQILPGAPQTATRWVTQPWAIDLNLEIGGYALRFDQAQIYRLGSTSDPLYQLVLFGPSQEAAIDGWGLSRLHFSRVSRPDGSVQELIDSLQSETPYGLPQTGWAGLARTEDGRLAVYLFPDMTAGAGLDLLPGEYRFTFDALSVYVPGPWDLSWSLIP